MQDKQKITSDEKEIPEFEVKGEEQTLDFNNPDFKFMPSGRHKYRQRGYYIICESCELQHAIFIGSEKMMVGETEEGEPIFKNRKDIER